MEECPDDSGPTDSGPVDSGPTDNGPTDSGPADGSRPERGRAIGIDLGERRIGIAQSDSRRRVATPVQVLERTKDPSRDRANLVRVIQELGGTLVVIGLPLGLDGSHGIAARHVLAEVSELERLLDVPVVTSDERLSTVEATRRRRESTIRERPNRDGRTRASRAGRPQRRSVVDDAAATVILQSFLDTESAGQ